MRRNITLRLLALPLLAAPLLFGCGSAAPVSDADPHGQHAFWTALQSLCGQAFEGRIVQGNVSDSTFLENRLVMHVRECGENEIRIPFHVGEDRSRTWVLTRTETGLRLKHDHRQQDGTPDEITEYGGDAALNGTPEWQEFPADSFTASLIPAAATNIWTIEVIRDTSFSYALRREGTDRRFRVEFDLNRPIPGLENRK